MRAACFSSKATSAGETLVCGGMQGARGGAGAGMGGAIAQEDFVTTLAAFEVRAESGVHAQCVAEEDLFCGDPVARWWV
jgi:hypothetical protein